MLYRVVPGSFSVTPTKPSFASGEDVELKIFCKLERKGGILGSVTWSSHYKVYDKKGVLLGSDSREHFIGPLTTLDTAIDDFPIKIGAFSPGLLEGPVVVSASG